MWLSHSERPLKANELCYAMGVEIGSTDLNSQNIPTIETLLGCSLGLVILEASSYRVRLVHYTLQEYLSNNTDLFPSSHSMIAEVCLTYLNFQGVRDLSLTFDWFEPPIELLEYASCYWGTHAIREMTESVKMLALRLLDGFEKHVSSWMLLRCAEEYLDLEPCVVNSTGFTGLHGSAYLGMVEIAVNLLEMGRCDLNATDIVGNTAISWAARKGHGAVAKMLLKREDVTPNTIDKYGRTPLSWAAKNCNEEIVKILLERDDVTPDTSDKDDRTPLSCAAEYGRKSIIKMLLEKEDVTPNTTDKDRRTPLSWASKNRNEEIVKIVLEREDVTPNTADNDGRTPLSRAAEYGHESAAKMLLERGDVTPNTKDKDGRTPLSWAAEYANEGIVKVLPSLAMGQPGFQILKPGPNPTQTIAGPTQTRPDPKKPGPPE